MSQLYVGNLSAEGDEKSIRLLFGKYGTVGEILMKSGYAFVEFSQPMSADEAMRELNGEFLFTTRCCFATVICMFLYKLLLCVC
jgi:RNA recognition motif-containing protein